MVRAEPTSNRTAGTDTNHSTMFTLLLQLNLICEQRCSQGWSQTFSFGGATGGASFATRGAVNGLCRTFRKRPTPVAWRHAENFAGPLGGAGKILGGSGPPGTPLAPSLGVRIAKYSQESFFISWQNAHYHLANLWNRITIKFLIFSEQSH